MSGKLKIKPEDYQVLKAAIEKILKERPGMRREYQERGLSEVRYRWDLFWLTGLRIGDGKGMKGDLKLYAYTNDGHIDSALKHIVKETERRFE